MLQTHATHRFNPLYMKNCHVYHVSVIIVGCICVLYVHLLFKRERTRKAKSKAQLSEYSTQETERVLEFSIYNVRIHS